MSLEVTMNSVSVRDKNTKEFIPIGMFSSDADKTLAQIKKFADDTKTATETDITKVKNDALNTMNNRYTEIVEGLPANYEELRTGITQLNESMASVQTTKADKTDLAKTNRSLEALWEVADGKLYTFEDKVENGVSVAPSGAMRQTLMDIRGKGKQQSYKGYNLINTGSGANIQKGVTATWEDAKFVLTGIPTVESGNIITVGMSYTWVNVDALIDGHRYRVKRSGGLGGGLLLTKKDESQAYVASFIWDSSLYSKVEPYVQQRVDNYTPGMSGIMMIYDETLYPNLTDADIEPYVGGIPSPSPSYPQDIVGVERMDVKVIGENIFKTIGNGYLSGATGAIGEITINVATRYTDFIPFDRDITVKLFDGVTSSSEWGYRVATYDDNKVCDSSLIQGVVLGTEFVVRKANHPTSKYIRVSIPNEYEGHIMVTFGNADTYEPYQETLHTLNLPRTMYSIGDYRDFVDVWGGVFKYATKSMHVDDSTQIDVGRHTASGAPFIRTSINGRSPNQYSIVLLCNRALPRTWNAIYPICFIDQYDKFTYGGMWADGIITNVQTAKQWLSTHNVEVVYVVDTVDNVNIPTADLDFLRSLYLLGADHVITITDQNGNDVSYLVEYLIDNKSLLASELGGEA